MSERLTQKKCVPCSGDIPALKRPAIEVLQKDVPRWNVVKAHHLQREFKFPDFKQALEFVNRVGVIAEQEGHHPDLLLSWGKVDVSIWTHKINGLTESDFILAAKIDQLSAT